MHHPVLGHEYLDARRVTARLGEEVGGRDPFGRGEVEQRQRADAGRCRRAARFGRGRVADRVQLLGPRVQAAGLVDQQVGPSRGLHQRVTRPGVAAVDDAHAVGLDDAAGGFAVDGQVID